MQLALRGLGYAFGDPTSNMACYLDPTCRSSVNVWCYTSPLADAATCSSWLQFNPTPAQIAANNTNAGPALTPANQALATQMAQSTVAADIAKNPQNYDALCGDQLVPSPIDGSCVPCAFYQTPSNGVCVFSWTLPTVLVAGLLGLGLLAMAVRLK
jgi:hypothetical protein